MRCLSVSGHVDEFVSRSVEETLCGLLDARADQLCREKRYEDPWVVPTDNIDSNRQSKSGAEKKKIEAL